MPRQLPKSTALARTIEGFAADVRRGLCKPGQKELPCKYFYDSLGSALFEAICLLPEYGLTRAEERIFAAHVEEIASAIPLPVLAAELGSGTGKKTRAILEAICRNGQSRIAYRPIDISSAALENCRRELQDVACVDFLGFEREYVDGLLEVAGQREEGRRLLVMFLGSTIGNFSYTEAAEFLGKIREILQEGDSLLLGTDLLKSANVLLSAYNDALGITAAFNLNLLTRINRELQANFDLNQFEHLAVYNQFTCSIEMHLRSRIDQTIAVPAAGISVNMREGETIWTETSHKFSCDELISLAQEAGFRPQAQWIDKAWCFAENLWLAA